MKLKQILCCILSLALPVAIMASCAPKENGPQASTATEEYDLSFTNREQDASYASSATQITLGGDSVQVSGSGASVSGSTVSITAEGAYVLSGSLRNGQILVAAGDQEKVQLVLNGVDIHCENSAPIYIQSGDKVFITLPEGTENTLTDGAEYTQSTADNVDGVVFSKSDLALNGSGSLSITASYAHGIVSKDDLIITGGAYDITANGQGLSGKDCVKILNGTFLLNTQADGIQSDNDEDPGRGFIYVKDGSFTINAVTDGIQAETLLRLDGGAYTITTGGGSGVASTQADSGWGSWGTADTTGTASAKGLKAGGELAVNGGTFTVDSSDDGVHGNGNVNIAGGTLDIASGDDGIHGDGALTVSGGTVRISQSYEGLEAASILVSGGDISLVASDDGLNASGGNDGSSLNGRRGQNQFTAQEGAEIRITGGILSVNAQGDGLDSNGNLYVEGGEVYVDGPVDGANGPLDYDGEAAVSGGVVAVAGSSQMALNFGNSSTQPAVLYGFSSTVSGGTTVIVTDSSGAVVLEYTPSKEYQCIVLSTPQWVQGESYTITAGGETGEISLASVSLSAGAGGGMGGNPGGKGDFAR